jgi:DNA-binding transcriptional ArsR family regulator
MSLAHASGDPFEALGDANRREILNLLGAGEKSVRELADALPISRPAVSRHLRLLKQAGLVAERPSGTLRLYRLQEQGVEVIQAYLRQVWGEAAARFTLLAENTRSHSESDQRSASNQSRSESTRSQ